jgi:hypothetical protein
LAYLSDVVTQSVSHLLSGSVYEPDDLWNGDVWSAIRDVHEERKYWYKGEEWQKVVKGQRDKDGNQFPIFPLQINPIAKVCRVHRAVMLGMTPNTVSSVPIKTTVSRKGLESAELRMSAEYLETFVNDVWWQNSGASMQFEACLQEQYYGGHVYRINWEPYNTRLPYRIGIYSLESPAYLLPVAWSPLNRWRLLEAYIGYEIPTSSAITEFSIQPKDKSRDTVLYMEHWTEKNYTVTVDGQVPVREIGGKHIAQEGENPFRMVPIVYIPHERDGSFYGRSLVNSDSPLPGLSKELNARMADRGEAVRDTRGVFWLRNARQSNLATRDLDFGNGVVVPILDIGETTLPGAPEPQMGVAQLEGPTDAAEQYDQDVWSEILQQADVTPVALGKDDTASGRITGPVTAYRMWPTMMHTMAERTFHSDGMVQIASIIHRIAQWAQAQDEFVKARVQRPPKMNNDMGSMQFGTAWNPMIPMEVTTQSDILNSRLEAGGISLHEYLVQQGTPNPEEEEERIWADRKRQADIEAEAEAAAMEARMKAMGNNQSQRSNE